MGQPSIQPKEPNASLLASGAAGQQPQQTPLMLSGNSGSNMQHKNHAVRYSSNNNDDEYASAALRQHKLIVKSAASNGGGGPSLRPVEGDISSSFTASGSSMYANNPQWGDKCYILDESDTNITAQEEYAKFDFQVRQHEIGDSILYDCFGLLFSF